MSGYDGVGATSCPAGLSRAGREFGRGTVEVSFDIGSLSGNNESRAARHQPTITPFMPTFY